MNQEQQMISSGPNAGDEQSPYKKCSQCKEPRPLTQFLRRTGRNSGKASRRGTCRACRKQNKLASASGQAADGKQLLPASTPMERSAANSGPVTDAARPVPQKRLTKRPLPVPPAKPAGPDASILRPTLHGMIRMRGKTDKGRRWQQDTDIETAVTLVREYAAVVVNRHSVRRLYSNKMFRQYILTRDQYTCYFCGEYGDTIDHLLPRAKGGHTTPVNCVCACNLCNQSKADRSVDEFMVSEE